MRKAFRGLSLKLHPDKSDDPDAERKFRQLVSVSEVLKDESKRAKYNNILENGLPDWRTGVYYMRRARKLGLVEMSVLVSLILTIGHYLCLVAAYHEKVFQAKEMIKKKEKKLNKEQYEELLQQVMETNDIRQPRIRQDNLPLRTVILVTHLLLVVIPAAAAHFAQFVRSEAASSKEGSESENVTTAPRVKKVRVQQALPDLTGETEEEDVGPKEVDSATNETISSMEGKEWTQEEILLLIKTCKKVHVGTSQRWNKIADVIGRSVDDVTRMSKSLRTGQVRPAEPLVSAKQLPASASVNDSDISSRDVIDLSDSIQNWSQPEQKLLEEGLQRFPRGVDGRWDKIAEYTGKSKVSD